MKTARRKTKSIQLGKVGIGSDYPVSIQSMTNTVTSDIESTLSQIYELQNAGCEIVRVAVPDKASAEAVKSLVKNCDIPIIADIHFDYTLALLSIKSGIHGVRLNPGNIGSAENVRAVADAANKYGIPIRVGSNTGSLAQKYRPEKLQKLTPDQKSDILADSLVNSAISQCRLLEEYGFSNIKVSLKASEVVTSVKAYRKFAKLSDYPLHLGITEAGTLYQSLVKSSVGIGTLLNEGIGDTIRVSITGEPVDEIKAAIMILESCGLRAARPEIISCPTCGRTSGNMIALAEKVEDKVNEIKKSGRKFKPSKIAVMGCAVNGPGEAKDAELGIAGAADGRYILFIKGKQIGAYSETEAFEVFGREILNILE